MQQAQTQKRVLPSFAITLVLLVFTNHSYGIEKPEFEVVFNDDDIEYRLYKPYLVAVTTVANDSNYGKAATTGFMRLFNYISGDNTSNTDIAMTSPVQQKSAEKISMTAPVQQTETALGWNVAFMLPSKYTMQTAPQPTDTLIEIVEVPARLMAVIRYSGRWTEKNFEKHEAKLRERVEGAGIIILSTPESAVYNPPFMPPFMRHNEVMFEVSAFPTQS